MGMCFVPDCKHYNQRNTCRFYRFPRDEKTKKMWIRNIRRADKLPTEHSQVCSCHFKDGEKKNGPSIFKHNENKIMMFESPEKFPKTPVCAEVPAAEILAPGPSSETGGLCCPSKSFKIYCLEKENKLLKDQISKLEKKPFSYDRIKHDNELINYHTGLPDDEIFNIVLKICTATPISYYSNWVVETTSLEDQLLITLMKLKLNLGHVDLAVRFGVSRATITNIFLTWLHVLHEILFVTLMETIPKLKKNQGCLPICFNHFMNSRMIVDCTEIFTDVPKRMDHQKLFYSSYKKRNTMKALIAVAPNGVITYTSNLYPGSTSDKDVFETGGDLFSSLNPGDLVLADKGFLITNLVPQGVHVNVPPFLYTNQFTPSEVVCGSNIARARIHVERAIGRVKYYKIIRLIPKIYFSFATKIFQVCSALTNFRHPLLKEVAQSYLEEELECVEEL